MKTLKPNQRLLGLDVGEKTIGLGLSDVLRGIASPMHTIKRTKLGADLNKIKEVASGQDVGGIVIGYPVNMDGSLGPKCQSVRQFARNLSAAVDLPIAFWDERMSTIAVNRIMLDADLSRQKRAENVDKLAATYILQGCLDYLSKRTI